MFLTIKKICSVIPTGLMMMQPEEQQKLNHANGLFYMLLIVTVILAMIIYKLYYELLKARENLKMVNSNNLKLQNAFSEIERSNKNYIRIMRVMAHDLRNPISGITGLATLLLDEEDFSDDSRHMLRIIESTGMHSIEMINELLKTNLSDETELMLKETVNLKELLFDSVELLQFKANEKQQRIVFESDHKPIITEVNYEKIWRVFNNLIVNAIKFSYPGGTINVDIKLNNDKTRIIVSVTDNGVGIPESHKDSIFEMFTSAKSFGTEGEESFGLGLSISKKIIEKHNGKIWFENNQHSGTIFFVELPCC